MSKAKRYFNTPTDILLEQFKEHRGLTPEGFLEASRIWVELTNRSVDLSDLEDPLIVFMHDVATGVLMPELVLAFGHYPMIMRFVRHLVPEDQARIASPKATVVFRRPDGTTVDRLVRGLLWREANQVFSDHHIRSSVEQKPFVPQPKAAPAAPVIPVRAHLRSVPFGLGKEVLLDPSDLEDLSLLEADFLEAMNLTVKQERELLGKMGDKPLPRFVREVLIQFGVISTAVAKAKSAPNHVCP